jgi:hypothetical protein
LQEPELAKLKSLISHAKLLVRKNNEILEATGGNFNIFRVCGVDHYETVHSAIVAEFLNPSGSHGLHDKFLNAFLSTIDDRTGIDPSHCAVKTEFAFDEGRIDILIEDDTGGGIVIENKIYAADGNQQVVRYTDFLKTKNPEHRALYYLTLSGKEADDCSAMKDGNKVDYRPISYSIHILGWLGKCIQIAAEYPMVRETLRQYRNHLKELLGMNSDAELEEFSKLICQDRESYIAARKIVSSWDAMNAAALSNYVVPRIVEVIEAFAQKNTLTIRLDEIDISSGPYSGFGFRIQGKNHHICFEFERGGLRELIYGVVKPKPSESQSFEQLPKGFKCSPGWACWQYVPIFRNWDDGFFSDMMFDKDKQSEFKATLAKCLEDLLPIINSLS